jgi:hypothetical protein
VFQNKSGLHSLQNRQHPFVYKRPIEPPKEDHQCILLIMPCYHIDEKNRPFVGVGNQKPLWQWEEMHLLGVDHGKVLILLNSPP